MKVRPNKFYIEKFRNFRNASFELGDKVTVISGHNGVGKSNVLSLIASSSGVYSNSMLGSNFQPEFTDFFNIDPNEKYTDYKVYLTYIDSDGNDAFTKRLSFKDDTKSGRGIRIIPRTTNHFLKDCTVKEAADQAKSNYGVGPDARVRIPTIYLSLSRLYPLGEQNDNVEISEIRKNNSLYKVKADEMYKKWYNFVIPNSIANEAELTVVDKKVCSRASLHMDLLNTPTLSQSIGQDNIGNIISALVDIYILSKQPGYNGALLCIDEIDVSLHPDTQIKMLNLFYKLASELEIQFVLSTHSLTILKEIIQKEKKNKKDYRLVYIKDSMAPHISNFHSYELLKAEMFGNLYFDKPKVKVYFEDKIGNELFRLLFKAFNNILYKVDGRFQNPVLRNSSEVGCFREINERIKKLKDISYLEERINCIPTILGCEELIKISKADTYFKRVVIILDGDARYKDSKQKPKIKDYLEEKYDQKKLKLNDRSSPINICFFPDYFAPESFLYRIIYLIANNAFEYYDFWQSMDSKEATALYTSDKIKGLFSKLSNDFDNDDLKNIFKDVDESEVWDFVENSDIVTYYYSDYKTVEELLSFMEAFEEKFNTAYSLTLENRYS